MGRARRAGGEPVVEEGADTVRLRILRGAAAAFGRKGYGATSVEVILAEARVSRRTFYKVFRSKDDVLRVLFENSVARLLAAVREAEQKPRSARVLLLEQFSPNSPLAKQRQTAMTAFTGVLSRTRNVLFASGVVSLQMVTSIVFEVWPGVNVSVPEVAT